jgi:hypothetical protein
MGNDVSGRRFVVVSLPRSGSTTLARLLNCHDDISCLIEPFHPSRYGGAFRRASGDARSLDAVLELIWQKWNGIKHVWEPNGWPFEVAPELNDRIICGPNRGVILLMRRNLLRRAVSHSICRQTQFWIGTTADFMAHLQGVELRALSAQAVRLEIRRDRNAIDRCAQSLSAANNNGRVLSLFYEDVFREEASEDERLALMNRVLAFLEAQPITHEAFMKAWHRHFEPARYRWSSREVYERIPGIQRVEDEVGSDETGWLFR